MPQGLRPNKIAPLSSIDMGNFMAVGNLLWAWLFGYLGSRLAVWIYTRRQREPGAAHARTDA
jgi:hypothetical protein